jgi:hypothetical protein
MTGAYSIQFHDRDRRKPMREKVFSDFASLYAFVRTYDPTGPDAINIHLPASASDEENAEVTGLGFQPN